jgi:hypothetical protein
VVSLVVRAAIAPNATTTAMPNQPTDASTWAVSATLWARRRSSNFGRVDDWVDLSCTAGAVAGAGSVVTVME